jgi:uroporphyrinogen decarboxylase
MKTDNNFDRMKKVLLRQGQPDRVPFYEHFVDGEIIEVIMNVKFSNFDLSQKDQKEKYVKTIIEFYTSMGYDYIPFEVGPNFPRQGLMSQDTAEHARAQGRGWVDENAGPIATWDDFNKYPWPTADNITDYSFFEFFAKNLPDNIKIIGGMSGGPFEHLSFLMGLVPLSMAIYDTPDLVQAMVDKIGGLIIKANSNIIQIGGLGALRFGDDMGFKTSTMMPPNMLRKYIFPWQKKAVELAHKNNLPFVLHSCGYLEEIMNDLIDDVKIDAKHSNEDVIIPMPEMKKRYGKRIALLGGVDVDKLCRFTEDEIRKHTRMILDECAPGGNYALGSGNTIANYVNVKNYLAMLDEGRKWHY